MNPHLYIIATPIGNLKDITYRAVETLASVDIIFAENPNHSRNLLSTYHIQKPVYRYSDYNYFKQIPFALNLAKEGKIIALITDAGTPTIQDPGYRIVKAFIDEDLTVCPIPGPSAFVCAISASGLATDKFVFLGFLPKSSSKQSKFLKRYDIDATIILYESPNRVIKTLENIKDTLGNRYIVVARELTKIYEEFLRGSVEEVLSELSQRQKIVGEVVILIQKNV